MSQSQSQPIIDAHHHFWDPVRNNHPWLRELPMIPFRYGDYSAIRKPFLPADLQAAAHPHNLVASVTMEGEWDERTTVSESAWMSDLAKTEGTPVAHVARAILHWPDAEDILAQHATYPLVRGIRHKPTAAPQPDAITPGTPGSLSDPNWQRGYRALQQNNLHFELQAPWWHVSELMALIEKFPETPVVINHAFMPTDRSPDALTQWHAALKTAASAPNTTIKISGIGISGQPWRLDDQRQIIDTCLDVFGPDRAMFASNFPVDSLVGEFATLFDGFKTATQHLSPRERNAVFHDTAIRVYRLSLPPLGDHAYPSQ